MLHRFGFPGGWSSARTGAITIAPGPHLVGGEHMLPVVRAACSLALSLAAGLSPEGMAWLPAHTLMTVPHFRSVIEAWLAGGAFPALGLTALAVGEDGGLRSHGLAYFIGQEIELDRSVLSTPEDGAKLAVRLIHRFVSNGPLAAPTSLIGTNGEPLLAEPETDGTTVRIWRQT